MRDRLHFESFPVTELDTGRPRYSGQPLELLTGGSGMFGTAPAAAPQNANGAMIGANNAGVQPHHGPIALLVLAVLILFLLDRAGFRFAVTAGKR